MTVELVEDQADPDASHEVAQDPEPGHRPDSRLMVVSNRLPIRMEAREDGGWDIRPSAGGLVTALHPVLSRRGGSWTGWPGVSGHPGQDLSKILENADPAFKLQTVSLTRRERDLYYLGFSNQVLWPLFHGFTDVLSYREEEWEEYRSVNWKFADTLARGRRTDSIWVQDYHLMPLASALRFQGYTQRMGFFLHIPFPPPEVFLTFPRHRELLLSLLHYDFLGFQTRRDHQNFLSALKSEPLRTTMTPDGRSMDLRVPRSRPLPISIDFDEWSSRALKPSITERVAEIRRSLGDASVLILGVDRLDYTKGIPAKIEGLKRALRRFPDLRGQVTLVQLVVPSRESIPAYSEQKQRIEALVEEVNGAYKRPGWEPVRYIYGSWDRDELTAHYRAADVALVTPIRDGMNLVAKEYCASRVREAGALILSRTAGAAGQLGGGAFLIDPRDPDEVAGALHRAVNAPLRERRERMGTMRKNVMEEDVHWWADAFLSQLGTCRPRITPFSNQIRARPARSTAVQPPYPTTSRAVARAL